MNKLAAFSGVYITAEANPANSLTGCTASKLFIFRRKDS